MVRIAADHPLFRDFTGVTLAPQVDLRGTSIRAGDAIIRTEVIPDKTRSFTVSDAVRAPGATPIALDTHSLPGQIAIGSDTLEDLKSGAARLDSGELAPTERISAHAHTPESLSHAAEDTGQTPVKLSVGFGFDAQAIDRAALDRQAFQHLIGGHIPDSQILPRTEAAPRSITHGGMLDLLA